jgi:FAD:protein FMN transferase
VIAMTRTGELTPEQELADRPAGELADQRSDEPDQRTELADQRCDEPDQRTDELPADTAQWQVWSTTARVVVSRSELLEAACEQVRQVLAEVDEAASRFRPDSQINKLPLAAGRPQQVSDLLAELIEVALQAARQTDGDVDPTLADSLVANGYDRDISLLTPTGTAPMGAGPVLRIVRHSRPDWRAVELDGSTLVLPQGLGLDLGATAKAFAADRAARLVAQCCGTGVLVGLGGDIATAGEGPDGGWRIRVQDGDDQPGCTIALPAGSAIATSSTIRRRWLHQGRARHHVLDPRTGLPADPVWRTVTVAAPSCVQANTLTTAALVRGLSARSWLRGLGAPARLVSRDGDVVALAGWPVD